MQQCIILSFDSEQTKQDKLLPYALAQLSIPENTNKHLENHGMKIFRF